ncbi:MAG: VCBS repeat-containing protein [Chloroflexi bacterium]|nr:VCBS repeat-containing protein [Chloroflexota bacterium]
MTSFVCSKKALRNYGFGLLLFVFLLLLAISTPTSSQSGGDYRLDGQAIGGGYGLVAGGSYALSGVAGQSEVDALAGGPYALVGGFQPGEGGQPQSRPTCLPRYGRPRFVVRVPAADEQGYEPEPASGDFNGDGLDDIFIRRMRFATTKTFPIEILLNDGSGGLAPAADELFGGEIPLTQGPYIPVIADFNGDGRDDIFLPDGGKDADPFPGYQNTLILSAPGGKLVDATAGLPQQYDNPHGAAAGDIDNDGDLDLYVNNIWGQNMIPPQIWLNAGDGTFTIAEGRLPAAQTNLSLNGYTASEFVDVNNDGAVDLVLGDAGDDLAGGPDSVVLLNDGSGRFSQLSGAMPSKPFAPSAIALDILTDDLNDDGHPDLLIAYTRGNYVGWHIQVLINNGDGTFRDETATRLAQSDNDDAFYVYQLAWMDIDRDQDRDLIARIWSEQDPNPMLFLNDGHGVFTRRPFDFGIRSLYYAFLDLEGDRGHDVVYATYAPPEDIYAIREEGCPLFLPLLRK